MSLYFTCPIPRKALWGGTTLRKYFHYLEDFGNDIGQCWVFSAQEGAPSPLLNGEYPGQTLSDLWQERPELFKSNKKVFPYIISLVAPEDDLSIQVHPDDAYGRALGYASGKNEAWVFLESPAEGSIVYGHSAQDQKQLLAMITRKDWQGLVQRLSVEKGDTVYIPAGTLHALTKGSVVYEIQQSTDVTYRFYDYDRRDQAGNTRPLQLEHAVACLHYGEADQSHPPRRVCALSHGREEICLENGSFVVRRILCSDGCTLCYPGYLLATIISGIGQVNATNVQIGSSFLIPAQEKVFVQGEFTMLTTSEM